MFPDTPASSDNTVPDNDYKTESVPEPSAAPAQPVESTPESPADLSSSPENVPGLPDAPELPVSHQSSIIIKATGDAPAEPPSLPSASPGLSESSQFVAADHAPTSLPPNNMATPDSSNNTDTAGLAGPAQEVTPGVVVAIHSESAGKTKFVADSATKKKRLSVKLLVPILILLILLGGSAAAYFGYYMNPSVIWQQSLSNMNGGYNKLISYLNTNSAAHYAGISENGAFTASVGGQQYSGSLTSLTDGGNTTLSAKVDLGVGKLDLEERSIMSPGNQYPDVYLKLSGLKAVDAALGGSLGSQIDSLDGQWIVIDHNLIADLVNIANKQQQSNPISQLTWSDIYSYLQAASQVNQKYLFTTNKNTAVMTVTKQIGNQTLNGQNTYEYQAALIPAHVQAYYTAMCSALQQSALGAYLQKETGTPVGTSPICTSLEKSAAKIKPSDTFTVWVNTQTRLISKVRIPDWQSNNPAQNFVDAGLNYRGGNTYPFFFNVNQTSGDFNLTVTLNSKTNSVNVVLQAHGSASSNTNYNVSGNFSVTPTNNKLTLTAPANATSIITVLNSLGLGQYGTSLQNMGTGSLPTTSPLSTVPVGLLTSTVR